MQEIERMDLGELATFVPNKKLPVYNWFYYKEGYSKKLVEFVAGKFNLKENDKVLDPFLGVGTTLLACKQLGFNAVGFDVSTVALFAAKVKTQDYDLIELKKAIDELMSYKFEEIEFEINSPIIKKAFSKYALQDIEFFKEKINKNFSGKIKDFLLLAIIAASTRCTYAEKHGGCIKINKKRDIPPFRTMLKHIFKRWLKDLKEFKTKKVEIEVKKEDSRKLILEDNSIDAIITSPPYLNKIEYTNVYAIEQILFFNKPSRPAVRSFIGEKVEAIDEDVFNGKYNLPKISYAYFYDMNLVLKEMFRVLKKGGKAAIVVGNGCFPDKVVESDKLLCELAERIGFKVLKFIVLNKRWCMKERTKKVGLMNETMFYLEK